MGHGTLGTRQIATEETFILLTFRKEGQFVDNSG
jgi:hypothetical protein